MAVALASCIAKPSSAPTRIAPSLSSLIATAYEHDAHGRTSAAVTAYSAALVSAASAPDSPAHIATLTASLDALVYRNYHAFAEFTSASALSERIAPNAAPGGSTDVELHLRAAYADARGPFARGLIAGALATLAERRGDSIDAERMRTRAGCARKASIFGPVSWTPVADALAPSGLDEPATAMPAYVATDNAFRPRVDIAQTEALGCSLPLAVQSSTSGMRDVAFDITVKQPGPYGLRLRSSRVASVRAGGFVVLNRPHALGSSPVDKFAVMHVAAPGTLRVVVRTGMESSHDTIELAVWNEHGEPAPIDAPTPGQRATTGVHSAHEITPPAPASAEDQLATALALLAARDAATAEQLLHPLVQSTTAPAPLLLTYARAVRLSQDLPTSKSAERARDAVARARKQWPDAWETIIEFASLKAAQQSGAEAGIETLKQLDDAPTASPPGGAADGSHALIAAFDAAVAGRERLRDRARQSFERAAKSLHGTRFLRAIERSVFARNAGAERCAFECAQDPARDRASAACFEALRAAGETAAAESEAERLRDLLANKKVHIASKIRHAIASGNVARARELWIALNPAEREMSVAAAVQLASSPDQLRDVAATAPDALTAIGPLAVMMGLGPSEVTRDDFASIANGADSATDRMHRVDRSGAATAVLAHEESYEVLASGLVHYVLRDVRRVMGTTDVDTNAEAAWPQVLERTAERVVRRRIMKPDGRILLPDPTAQGEQSHADLSQLEAGDAIEASYEGWALPGETGTISIDSPDLLPERTSVHDARIELRVPENLPSMLWTHPLLGRPSERVENGARIRVWNLSKAPVRRLEASTTRVANAVGISFSTASWKSVALGLRETLASMQTTSIEVADWAQKHAKCNMVSTMAGAGADTNASCQPTLETVRRIVAAAGKAVKESSSAELSDFVFRSGGGGQVASARTVLSSGEGSRTILIAQALRELGIHVDIAIAENEPFPDFATYPPHAGRFTHPLVIAHLGPAGGSPQTDAVWIDADVAGPPLPAGHISPELRGRSVLYADGRISPIAATLTDADTNADEIDERWQVQIDGSARGTLTMLFRGAAAHDLADLFSRIAGNERQSALRSIALAWVPFATIDRIDLSSDEDSWQVAIRADIQALDYAQREPMPQRVGRANSDAQPASWSLPGVVPLHTAYPRATLMTLSAAYANRTSRESALAINRATQFHHRRRIELPEGTVVSRIPGPFASNGALLNAGRTIAVNAHIIEERFTVDLRTGTVSNSDYPSFIQQARRVDDAFGATLRVQPPIR